MLDPHEAKCRECGEVYNWHLAAREDIGLCARCIVEEALCDVGEAMGLVASERREELLEELRLIALEGDDEDDLG